MTLIYVNDILCGVVFSIFAYCKPKLVWNTILLLIYGFFFVLGSPIHQHQLVSDSQHRHQKVDSSSSPIHQFYPSISDSSGMPDYQKYSSRDHNFKISDATLGLPPETYQPPTNYTYDPNRSFGSSPLHSANISPYASTSNNLGSPIHQNIYGTTLPNLGLYSGTNSPILNPLLSPNASPVFGGYSPGTSSTLVQPTSITSITQGEIYKWTPFI